MVAQDKLIKQGIKYTDSLFDEIINRLEQGIRNSDTLEAFLEKTKDYTSNNPLVTTGYDATMLKLILQETNNHKFSRPAQKELIRVTIENQVGELIKNVGEDIQGDVRDIVREGYDQGLSQDEIARNMSNRVTSIRNSRARVIARTEIARTATISDYVINKEMGATHFYVECRNTACPICKEAWHKNWNEENDDSFNPSETSAGGKGWIGDKHYSMDDVGMLPPLHPNCRCVPYFIRKGEPVTGDTGTTTPEPESKPLPTPQQLKKNLRPQEREKYNSYQRNIERQRTWFKENPNASAEDIAKHRKRLAFLEKKFEELRAKAVGDSLGSTAPKTPKPKKHKKPKKPKTNSKPKKPEPKPTPSKKTKEEVKPKKSESKPEANIKESLGDIKKKILTKEEVDKLSFKELAEHYDAEYQGVQVYDYDERSYHIFKQKCANGRELTIYFEDGAVDSYTKKGIASPNEIIQEVFKVPEVLRNETNTIWFKNTNQGIKHTISKSGYDSLGVDVGGYNTLWKKNRRNLNKYEDYGHNIVINPKYFKGATGKYAVLWIQNENYITSWKYTIFHEMTHSGDTSKSMWESETKLRHSLDEEYREISREEMGFTDYAMRGGITESFAEHGGYIACMEMNPNEQDKLIPIYVKGDKGFEKKRINYEEYKKIYPKHYEYFMKKFKGGF